MSNKLSGAAFISSINGLSKNKLAYNFTPNRLNSLEIESKQNESINTKISGYQSLLLRKTNDNSSKKISSKYYGIKGTNSKNAINNSIQIYHNGIGDQAAKFNGSQYQGYTVSFSDGHPYFKADVLAKGKIVYDGVLFENVNVKFKLNLKPQTSNLKLNK